MVWVTSDGVPALGTPSTATLGLGEAPRSVGGAWEDVKRWGNGSGLVANASWILVLKGSTWLGFYRG
jgi:hypothetical protein